MVLEHMVQTISRGQNLQKAPESGNGYALNNQDCNAK